MPAARLARHPAAILEAPSARRRRAQEIHPSFDRLAARELNVAHDAIVFALLALARHEALVSVEPGECAPGRGKQNRFAMHEVVPAAGGNRPRVAAEVVEVRVRDGGGAEAVALSSEPQALRF